LDIFSPWYAILLRTWLDRVAARFSDFAARRILKVARGIISQHRDRAEGTRGASANFDNWCKIKPASRRTIKIITRRQH
jgi:hypothetical protein